MWSGDCDIRVFSQEPQRHEIVKISLIILPLSLRLRYCGGVGYVCESNLKKKKRKKKEQQPRRKSKEKLQALGSTVADCSLSFEAHSQGSTKVVVVEQQVR